jgi:hypothetical protein
MSYRCSHGVWNGIGCDECAEWHEEQAHYYEKMLQSRGGTESERNLMRREADQHWSKAKECRGET